MKGSRTPTIAKRDSLQVAYHRFLYRRAERHLVSGVPVALLLPTEEDRAALTKVAAALELIARLDPHRFARIRQDVRGIFVFGLGSALGACYDALALILLERDYLIDPATSAAEIAATIVHEATHARLSRRGFEYAPECRCRIERVCFRAELAFARRLPDGTELVRRAEANLARPPEFWTDHAMRGRSLGDLRSLGVPAWLVWLLGRLSNRGAA